MNELLKRLLVVVVLSVVTARLASEVTAQNAPTAAVAPQVRVDGLVFEHQKYSFTLRGLDRDYKIVIPNGTPLWMKLTLPEFDFGQKRVSVELLVSAADGDPQNNLRESCPLPDPLWLTASFDDAQDMKQQMGQAVPELDKFMLSAQPVAAGEFSVQGILRPGPSPGQFLLEEAARTIPVRLGPRKGLMSGAGVTDLRPHETEVFVEGDFEGDALVASSIRFQHVGDPFARFDPALPNGLIIGDQISIGYDPALRAALAGRLNIHHPPCNCGGVENWRDIHRWVANPDRDGRRWDVIAFNFGLQDASESESVWKANLVNAIKTLEKTGARLVWINSTPIPRGLDPHQATGPPLGRVTGRMELQNKWATDVLRQFPDVVTCDLWGRVAANPDNEFDDWWNGKSVTFNGIQNRILGQAVGEAMLQAAGLPAND